MMSIVDSKEGQTQSMSLQCIIKQVKYYYILNSTQLIKLSRTLINFMGECYAECSTMLNA